MNRYLVLVAIAALIYLSTTGLALPAQTPAVIIPPSADVFHHHVGPTRVIHAECTRPCDFRGVTLQVVVNAQGRVESAHATSGPQQFFAEAEAIAMSRRFKPFELNGQPIRASISDYVEVVPPEQWGTKVPFPEVKDWNSLRFTLNRPEWYCESCPNYSVEIQGDGTVTFRGNRGEMLSTYHPAHGHRDESVLITGTHHAKLSRREVETLLSEFRQADFFSLKDKYMMGATDGETIEISLSVDGHTKRVTDYAGLQVGMPEVVRSLERAIDETAGVDRWINGTSQTWPSLLAEHWDFKAQTDENRLLLQSVIAHGDSDLIARFLAAGAPALAADKNGMSPLVSAAENGDLPLVKQMVGTQHLHSALLASALNAAARSGNTELLDYLLEKGADVNAQATDIATDDDTVLLSAVESGKAEMVRAVLEQHPVVDAKDRNGETALMRSLRPRHREAQTLTISEILISAGANVSARDNQGQTPLFHGCHQPQAVKLLVKAGAELNVQDIGGRTPLMTCPDHAYLQALIEAGADLSLRNQYGQTASEQYRSYGITEHADFLEAAAKVQKH